ncbi:helix-turn-helix transcriptional regulator [Siccationidurans ginsengisoli]|uniref:helix-turn-helix domain-containing protein n=1 Tax=Hymenobacter TaxID=89966 RepID=UPI001AAC7196|nr:MULTISPECIES: AraC family transcriptional regulator [unclassified Hymenobacter]MBO2033471.1 helix-turn-helix transcriptional regulator [Hymenobacter sp. BT559]
MRPATFAARVALAERYLRALFQRRAPDYRFPLVQAAIACLTPHSSAPAAVTQVAEHLNVSPKSLTRHFQHLVGVGPKRCAQLIRFKAALTAYRQSAPSFDAEAAGYADFTHFARASHRLVGRSLAEL